MKQNINFCYFSHHKPISEVYSYSPFPSQSDPHPVKVVNFLPKNPATKDINSAYEQKSYPSHEYTALHGYNSYPAQEYKSYPYQDSKSYPSQEHKSYPAQNYPAKEYISYPAKTYPAQNYYTSPAPEYENYPVYPPHAFYQHLYHPQYKVRHFLVL